MATAKSRIAYFYDNAYTGFYYGADHPMKPQRIAMTHSLILGYGLHEHMDVFRPRRAQQDELTAFHSKEYVEVLRRTTPEQARLQGNSLVRYGIDNDCPIFHGLFDFCRLYAGASVEAARRLNRGQADVAINWGGGLHHAKKAEASGFCYVNDCVLAILELLKEHARVLYVDIDIHHGDGVEEAFYTTDRVMTVSFHLKREGFFPGSGAIGDVGECRGRGYSVNVPLEEGIDDDNYRALFRPIMDAVVASFRPGAIVLQCGADSVTGDRLGPWNLSAAGHAEAVRHVKAYGLPLLVLGGGGYIKTTVARTWTLETAVLVGQKLEDTLPQNPYLEYFSPEYRLSFVRQKVYSNLNKRETLEQIRAVVLENLKSIQHAPGVALADRPPEALLPEGAWSEDAVHDRLKEYTNVHYGHYLSCVEEGYIPEGTEL
ncbi:histone deacetylase [Helicosporidium sp. ATCC 50920]|nr:histone deacetylase [Helicosporidium sp. ATCC 50920]|eukprot:KDD75688.1 histone deacetylase [Helicosporidium sp. ATCC 50920]